MQLCERLVRADDEETRLWTRIDEAWNGKSVAPLTIPNMGSALMFSTGFGDGMYTFAWGVDRAQAPVCLVVDLDVVQADFVPSAYSRKRSWWRLGR